MSVQMERIDGMSSWAVLAARSFILVAILLTALGGEAMSQAIVMKLSTATLNDAQHEWMKRFAGQDRDEFGGRIKAEIYPASQLGAIPRQIEGTQLGSIQAWIGPPEFLVGRRSAVRAVERPGPVQERRAGAQDTLRTRNSRRPFCALGANKGLVGASLFP